MDDNTVDFQFNDFVNYNSNNNITISFAETVSAGAVSNCLCSEPGSSKFFLGGIVAYNMEVQKNLLGVDSDYAEKNNFANHITTLTMAKTVATMFKSNIGMSNTGYSLPLYRPADLESGKCEINVIIPYAYICLYDARYDSHKIFYIENIHYKKEGNQKLQRTEMQMMVALRSKAIYDDYLSK